MATKSKQKLPSRIPVDPVRSLDGFSLGDRVAYREESVFRFSQEDVDTKACPPNDFVIRSFVSRDGQSSAYLIDADGNNAGCEETHNLDKLSGKFRLFSILDDACDANTFAGPVSVSVLHDYVRANHGERDAISLVKFDSRQLDRLLAVYVSSRIEGA
jgi:hypothetical protein